VPAAKPPQANATAPQAPAAKTPQDKASAEEKSILKTPKDKLSYGLGVQMGSVVRQRKIEVQPDLIMKGLWDSLAGEKLLMTDAELRATFAAFQAETKQKQDQARAKFAEENKKAGEAFLAQNKTKEGVFTLPSGLQYKILKAGNGKKATDGDTVVCHYRGATVNGAEFGNSRRGSKPATIRLAKAIPGWKEALKLMPVGSQWQLVIPPQLAFGARGAGRTIGPNSTLIFEIELVGIKPPQATEDDETAPDPESSTGAAQVQKAPEKVASKKPGSDR
jgi:FKBP-type peptidyl-prolyl cis-trans isomerase FklB